MRQQTTSPSDGNAIVYCDGAYGTTNGKTAHGLVRTTQRYRVLSVIDASLAGRDAGEVLDGTHRSIPIVARLSHAIEDAQDRGHDASHFVVGVAPDGGRLDGPTRTAIKEALRAGLNVDCGLHDFVSEDDELAALATRHGVCIRDIRKPPAQRDLHFFNGKIERVEAFKVAVLGTDSAVGKRTTAARLVAALQAAGEKTTMIGTGQTSWLQGARFCTVIDSLVNDFVSGEIEHTVWSAWNVERPSIMVIEGQGSLLSPAYPGGFEILAAARPDIVVLQHAPTRREYDGFAGYRIQSLHRQIEAIEIVSGRSVAAVTINHEGLTLEVVPQVCRDLETRCGLPVFDVLLDGADGLVRVIQQWRDRRKPPPARVIAANPRPQL